MPIDWGATGDFWSGIGTILGAGALIYAAKIGKGAISDFRLQKVAGREIDVAEQVLTAAYRARDAIEGMRGRFMPAGELEAAEKQLKELGLTVDGMPDADKSAHIQRGVFYRRAEFFKDDFNAVFDAIAPARVFFGAECVDSLRAFPKARNYMLSSADMLPMMSHSNSPEDQELQVKIRRDLYGKWRDEDEDGIGQSVINAMTALENQLLPIVRSTKND